MLAYGILIVLIIGFLIGIFGSVADSRILVAGISGWLFGDILHGILIALSTAFVAWIFNIISGIIDGIDIELEKKTNK